VCGRRTMQPWIGVHPHHATLDRGSPSVGCCHVVSCFLLTHASGCTCIAVTAINLTNTLVAEGFRRRLTVLLSCNVVCGVILHDVTCAATIVVSVLPLWQVGHTCDVQPVPGTGQSTNVGIPQGIVRAGASIGVCCLVRCQQG